MNIHVEAVGPSRKQISIEFPATEVDRSFQEVVANYQRFARIPGFRPGKAPTNLVRNRFRKEIIKEMKEFLIPRGYQQAIKQENIETVRVIEVTEPEPVEGQPYGFMVTVDVFPEFTLPDYKAIRVEPQPVTVEESSIDDVVNRMRERMASYNDAPGKISEKSDRVVVNYRGSMDGVSMETIVNEHAILAKAENFGIILDPEFAFIPEFADALIGVSEGQTKSVEVQYSPEFIEKAVAGKKAVYDVEVLKVQTKKLPELDADFLKTLGADSVESLRERIQGDLSRMKADQERRRVEDEMCRKLLDQTAMTLPESEVQRQTSQEIFDLVEYNTTRGIDKGVIEENRDQIFSAAAKSAEEKLKIRFILLKIAQTEKIAVTDAELETHIRIMAQRAHKDPAKLKAELEKNNRMDDVREDMLAGRALRLLQDLQQPQVAKA